MSTMLISTLCIALLGSLWSSPAALAETRVDLEVAIAEALQQNPELVAQQWQITQAEAEQLKAARFLTRNPELELEWAGGFLFGNPAENAWEIRLSQELEIAGQRGIRLEIAALNREEVRWNVLEARRNVVAAVKHVFFDTLFLQQKLTLNQELAKTSAALRSSARERFEADDLSQLDYKLIELEYERTQAEVLSIQAELQAAYLELGQLLGRAEPVEIDESLFYSSLVNRQSSIPLTLPELERKALAQRPVLHQLAAARMKAEQQTQLLLKSRWPDLKLHIGFAREDSAIHREGISVRPEAVSGIEAIRDSDNLLAAGVSLPIPLLSIGPEVKGLEARIAQLEARRQAQQQLVLAEVRGAFQRWQKTQAALAHYQRIVAGAQQTMDLLMLAYQAGEMDLPAVLAAQERLSRTRLAALELQRAQRAAWLDLEAAVGDGLP